MALGELTKQLAEQALSETLRGGKPAGAPPPDNPGAAILGQIQAMQKALKEDEELLVLANAGVETIRVLELLVPTWQVFVLKGVDAEKNVARIVSHVESLQLTCKVVKVAPSARPVRLGFFTPKVKPE